MISACATAMLFELYEMVIRGLNLLVSIVLLLLLVSTRKEAIGNTVGSFSERHNNQSASTDVLGFLSILASLPIEFNLQMPPPYLGTQKRLSALNRSPPFLLRQFMQQGSSFPQGRSKQWRRDPGTAGSCFFASVTL